MTLGEVVERLKREDESKVVPVGFDSPDSYRGYYEQLGFCWKVGTTVGEMLKAAKGALGHTFYGYKGGEYEMYADTDCWLVTDSSACGEPLTILTLELMLGKSLEQAAQEILRILDGEVTRG